MMIRTSKVLIDLGDVLKDATAGIQFLFSSR